MSLFTGNPNAGYIGLITFTPNGGSQVTLPCNAIDSDTLMRWQQAPIFNAQGFMDHSKGLSDGVVRASGIWDTGLNVQSTIKLGTQGLLVVVLNNNPDEESCSYAKVSRWHVNIRADGQCVFDVEFLIDNTVLDFHNAQFNNPTVS